MASAAALGALAASAAAKIDLSTLPERGDVELTIYNAEDLTLVREKRSMAFKDGENPLQFSWANTLIDPTSVHLQILEGEDWLTIDDISYPANTSNTLIWTIQSEQAGEGLIEITYFTSGITWEADYVAKANADEKALDLEGYVRVTNNSGEDYLDAKTRLLVGQINLVEAIAVLAQSGPISYPVGGAMPRSEMEGMESYSMMAADEEADMGWADDSFAMAAVKEVAKEGVSEYFLFTIEGRENLENGLSKRLPSFDAEDVPVEQVYTHDPRRFGDGIVKLYTLINEKPADQEESEMGSSPLPDGFYQVFAEREADGLAYLGRHDDKYIPIGEDLEINLGSDGLVSFEDLRRRYKRINISYSSYGDVQGWDDVEEREVVVRNSKRESIPVEIRRTFGGDFDFEPTDSTKWEKISDTEYELKATLEPMSENRFAYTLVVRQGANAKK